MRDAMTEPRIERGKKGGEVKGGGVFQRPPQHQGIDYRLAAVADANATGFLQRRHFRQPLAAQAMRQCAQGQHPAVTGGLGPATNQLHHRRFVNHRIGVGRADQRGNASSGGGFTLAGDSRLVFVARFPQTGAEINQARTDDTAISGNLPIRRKAVRGLTDADDVTVSDKQVQQRINLMRGIKQSATANGDTHQAHSSSGRA
jgi:hypothetical protein